MDLPRITTPEAVGQETAIVPGKIGDLGSSKTVSPYGVVYYRPGVTVREFNHADLRLPQKREFLGPEFFNGGCATLYANGRLASGPSSATTDTAATSSMLDRMFASQPYFEGNQASCYNAGVKGNSPNSALGWMMDKDRNLLWEAKSPDAVRLVCQGQV